MKRPLLLLHGNAINSKIWDLIRNRIPKEFEIFAPDLRGYGTASKSEFIHAENGVFDWVDDIQTYARKHNLNQACVWGHSLGGNILWGLLAQNPEWIDEMVFISPGSPYGFGGTKEKTGILTMPDAAGTGAGMVHPKFVQNLQNKTIGDGSKSFDLVSVFSNLFYQKPSNEILDKLIECALEMQISGKSYPGDFEKSVNWPFVKPGKFGPVNALTPINQQKMIELLKKSGNSQIRLKWIRGANDEIVSNSSYADAGILGKNGVIPNWPGEEIYPAQPMLDQIRAVFELKISQGYSVEEIELPNCGHFPFLESEKFWELVFDSSKDEKKTKISVKV